MAKMFTEMQSLEKERAEFVGMLKGKCNELEAFFSTLHPREDLVQEVNSILEQLNDGQQIAKPGILDSIVDRINKCLKFANLPEVSK